MAVLGIDYSSQVENRKGLFITRNLSHAFLGPIFGNLTRLFRGECQLNNGKGGTINLRNEIKSYKTNGKFDNLTSNEPSGKRDEYERQYEAKIEQPVNINDCVIM